VARAVIVVILLVGFANCQVELRVSSLSPHAQLAR